MNLEIDKVSWFPTNVFHCKLDDEICDRLSEKVFHDKDKWTKGLRNVQALTTGWDGLSKYEELKVISNFICKSILPKIGESQKWKFNQWQTREAWINFYQKGDSANIHNHGFSDFCGVLILTPGKGNLVFLKTEFIEGKTRSFENIENQKINESKGTLILFPGYLYHSVSSCENERISVAFNFENHMEDE
jgi:hypothetical protein